MIKPSASVLADLAIVAETLGDRYRLLVDDTMYELRATGPHRWDVHRVGDDHETHPYGAVTATAGPNGVLWRFPLVNYYGAVRGAAELADAIRDLVADRPADVDPLDLADQAEQTVMALVTVLNSPDPRWSADYPGLLMRLRAMHEGLGAVYDHVHAVAIALAADRDSAAWGKVAERAADSAERCADLTMFGELGAYDARAAVAEFTPTDFVRGILTPYLAARQAEADAGQAAPVPVDTAAPEIGAER